MWESDKAVLRAAARFRPGSGDLQARIRRESLTDENPWVRRVDVQKRGRSADIARHLSDPHPQVRMMAALVMLRPETLEMAELRQPRYQFRFEDMSLWSSVTHSFRGSRRTLRPVRTRPPWLDVARKALEAARAAERTDEAAYLGLLLAQYGDDVGVADAVASEEGIGLAAIALSADGKWLPFLRKLAAKADREYELRPLLRAAARIRGREGRDFRREINLKMRRLR
jgi:hypothetical protein